MDLTNYLKTISKFNLLTKQEEQELFRRVKDGDSEARSSAINSNLRLVINIAKRYLHTKVPFLDLIQEGNMGLIKAVDKFDPERDKRFSTYATFWIKQSVLRYLNDTKNAVRYPSYVIDYMNKISKFMVKYRSEKHKTPSEAEIAAELEIDRKEVRRIMDLMNLSFVSLDDQFEEAAEDFVATTEDIMCEDYVNTSLVEMVKRLRGKEQNVIVHRYGLFGNKRMTLEKIAETMDLTRERVRQIQNNVLAKLRDRIKHI